MLIKKVFVTFFLRMLTWKKTPSNKAITLSKSMNMEIGWLAHQINSFYKVLKLNQSFRKI